MKVYYAHCMAIYNTPQELRDMALLAALGFEPINPNSTEVKTTVDLIAEPSKRMAWFQKFADECDAIAFRALPDGAIPAGVGKEIQWFQEKNKPVIELPSGFQRRMISLDATREYLREVGQR